MAGISGGGVGGAHRYRFHCSYHKCLTRLAQTVFRPAFDVRLSRPRGYRHFRSELDLFYAECHRVRVASINNHVLGLGRFEDVRVTRFVRDPRDLVVSGYFYHRAGREPWCHVVGPGDADLAMVNGAVPSGMPRNQSFADYLNSCSLEQGLMAEIEFRARHFESMRRWPDDDPRIRVFRYEEIVGREVLVFRKIFQFLGLPWFAYPGGLARAYLMSTARLKALNPHVRNPEPGQWRTQFTPAVDRFFRERHQDLLEKLRYE